MQRESSQIQPLAGVRVADFSSNMAGPFGAMILAQLGADVIKIEPPQGDDAREWPPFVHGVSATHRHMNAGKRGMIIDLKKQEGVDVALALIARSDVLLQSMRPGVAERIGIGKAAALARNPDLLYYELSAFGDGPRGAAMPGYDPLVQAFTGIMQMTGHEGSPATRCAPSIIDLSSGQWIAMGVLAAMLARQKGSTITSMQTALVDTAFNLVPHQAMNARVTGKRPAKSGSGNTIAAPYQCFSAADGEILVAAPSDRLWRALLQAIDASGLADEAAFSSNSARVKNVRELEIKLNAIFAKRDVQAWIERLTAAGVPAARVAGLEESVKGAIADERQTFIENDGAPLVRLPWLIDGKSVPWKRAAPKLGEHTVEILKELGFRDGETDRLIESGAVGATGRADDGVKLSQQVTAG